MLLSSMCRFFWTMHRLMVHNGHIVLFSSVIAVATKLTLLAARLTHSFIPYNCHTVSIPTANGVR